MEPKDRKIKGDLPSKKTIFINNFIAGIAWGLGSVLGATVIVGMLGILITRTKNVPFVGDIIQNVVEQVREGTQEITDSNTTTPQE